jgi:hypothetical protein
LMTACVRKPAVYVKRAPNEAPQTREKGANALPAST